MKAVVRRGTRLICDEIADLTPGAGQVLVKTLACGICGSDLHALHHADKMAEMGRRSGAGDFMDPSRDIVFGHEFCAEILDHGPGNSGTLKAGTRIVSVPMTFGATGLELIGYSNTLPGGFAQQMLLTEAMLLEVPNGLPSTHAALTEPLAVGLHAVNQAALDDAGCAVVIGCGPVGLAIIACLKARGFGPVIAADYSPIRRAVAEKLGADKVVNPAEQTPYGGWAEFGIPTSLAEHGMAMMMGQVPKRAVIFECVGVPGLLQQVMEGAAPLSQIIVVGVCMESDKIEPALAINKQLDLRFVLGYSPIEFAQSLSLLAEGTVDATPFVTGTVDLAGTPGAFETLAKPEAHIKIIVQPN
jgi:threonine dehydrogenase-like Zn-dependent dehydrogenase